MKKVLIVSYDYLPKAHAASFMVQSRAKYLAQFGWMPVILTRHWPEGSNNANEDIENPLSNEQDVAINGLVYRTPYKQYLKYWFDLRAKWPSDTIRFKVINFILRTFFSYPCEVRGWLKDAVPAGMDIVKKEQISIILSVGSPWTCHLVSRNISRATGIPWIATYMDPWTQPLSEEHWKKKVSLKWFIRNFISRFIEKSICFSAYCGAHNSKPWAEQLEKMIGKKVYSLPHGVDHSDFSGLEHFHPPKDKFIISYIGSMHFTQKTQIFLEGFSDFITENNIPKDKLRLRIIGSESLHNCFKKYKPIYEFIENVPYVSRPEALKYMKESHILLLFLMNDDGWYPMKFFEYLATDAQILATPRDYGVVEQALKETNKGAAFDSTQEVAEWLEEKWNEFIRNGQLNSHVNQEALKSFDRQENIKKLAQILDIAEMAKTK